MPVTPDDVRHVAHLARLRLDGSELARMSEQLQRIVEYIDRLQELDTEGVEPLAHPLAELVTPLRPDQVHDSLPLEDALANAPDRFGPFFKVPRMIEGDSDA